MTARPAIVSKNLKLDNLEDLKNNLLQEIKIAEAEQRTEDATKIKEFLGKYQHMLVKTNTKVKKPKIKEEIPLDLSPYKLKNRNTLMLVVIGISLAIFGVFEPNTISTTLAYIVLLLLVAKDKI